MTLHDMFDAHDRADADMAADLAQTTADLAQRGAELEQTQAALDQTRAEFAAYVAAHPEPTPPPPEPTVVELVDFTQQSAGLYTEGSLVGDGMDATIYRMRPRSSTKTAPTSGTNQLKVIRTGGLGAAKTLDRPVLADLSVEGTDQGHLYGGPLVGWSNGAHVHDVRVTGIPGNASSPPGETFCLALWHAAEALVEDVILDGRQDGREVAATLLGLNDCHNPTVRRVVANHALYGMAVAVWQGSGRTLIEDVDFRECRHPINFEQYAGGGTIEINRVDLRAQKDVGRPHVTLNSSRGSSRMVITDPVWDEDLGPLHIGIAVIGAKTPPTWDGGLHTQRKEDVVVIKDGVDITRSPRVKLGY